MLLTVLEFWLYTSLLVSAGFVFGASWAARRREEELLDAPYLSPFYQRVANPARQVDMTPVLRSSKGERQVAEAREAEPGTKTPPLSRRVNAGRPAGIRVSTGSPVSPKRRQTKRPPAAS